jgi:two-component system response regulator AtoC
VLQENLMTYEWPGNIRELENMMKRLVVLQDENLILAEIGRLRTARAAADGAALVPAPVHVAFARPVAPMPAPVVPFPVPVPADDHSSVSHGGTDGMNLQELARHAAMGAEKEAIQHALERFRWNRRKTAEYLQVSYKTLLNKMKECGISEAPGA